MKINLPILYKTFIIMFIKPSKLIKKGETVQRYNGATVCWCDGTKGRLSLYLSTIVPLYRHTIIPYAVILFIPADVIDKLTPIFAG